MWMVRSDGGKRYDDFRDLTAVGIGFPEIAELAYSGASRKALLTAYSEVRPGIKQHSAMSAASQVYRFVNEIGVGDLVVTHSPTNRRYLVGTVRAACTYQPDRTNLGMDLSRPVDWLPIEVDRDRLTVGTRNSLGSVMTVFKLPDSASAELLAAATGAPVQVAEPEIDTKAEDPLEDFEAVAFERIKDQVNQLDWADLQELVAGILRAMSYKTQVSPPGSDLGRDILASPDGFGFEQPRIVVEVKHRKGSMGSQEVRSFLVSAVAIRMTAGCTSALAGSRRMHAMKPTGRRSR